MGDLEWSYVTGDPIVSSPAINATGEVYIGSKDNQFYAFNAVGGLMWSYTHPGGATTDEWVSSPVIDATGLVYLQARRSLCVFDYYGSLLWSFSTNAASTAHSSSPALGANGEIYWGTGSLQTLYTVKSNWGFGWSYRTAGTVESSPAVGSGGNIYVGSNDNSLYAITAAGALAWTYVTGDDIYSSPAVDIAENIYVGSEDNRFYALTSTGILLWSYLTNGANIDSSPAIDARDWVYVGAQDSRVYAFESNGTIVWTYKAGESVNSSPAIGSEGKLYVGSNDNKLHAVGSMSVVYTLYADQDPGLENWMAIPFVGTGIGTTIDLGNRIAALFTFQEGDIIVITRKIGIDQSEEITSGYYDGAAWVWSPELGYPIVVEAMYKVTIVRAAGYAEGDLTIAGCFDAVEFSFYDLPYDDDNENWISLPWNKGYLTTTVEIGESIGAAFTPEVDDTLTIAVWDVATQSENATVGTYDGSVWSWDPSGGYDTWPGMPFIVRPYRSGGMPMITWP